MNVSPNILAKNLNLKKLRYCFVDKRTMVATILISSGHWKTLAPFCFRKKILEKAILRLTVNYRRKIIQKSKLCHSRQRLIGYLVIYVVI